MSYLLSLHLTDMSRFSENLYVTDEDKLEFFDEIFCKIQSKNHKNTEYLTDFIDFIEVYTTIIIDEEETEYIKDNPFDYNDIKNLTILEDFYEITDVYNINYFNDVDSYDDNYINDFNHYVYYDFNKCPKKIFSKMFINDFKIYIYNTLNLGNTLK